MHRHASSAATLFARVAVPAAISAAISAAVAGAAFAQTELRMFVSSQGQPEIFQEAIDAYMAAHPDVKVELELGGATSELQAQYLNTVLSASDPSLDVFVLDVVRPAQFAAAGWAEPLDAYVDDKDALMAEYLPAYAEANQVDGKLLALPAYADAMFLYYRTDLLEKYGQQVPTTWDELAATAKTILEGENDPTLQGVSFQGAAIEGAVCSFLLPYWSLGHTLEKDGEFAFDADGAARSFEVWLDLMAQGVAPANSAEVKTDDTRKSFQGGDAVFAVLWAYGWSMFQGDDSEVTGNVGVARLPAVAGGEPVTCLGGWEWAVSAFSEHKDEAAELVKYLSGPEVSKLRAVKASNLPARLDMYEDADVLAAAGWFADALPVVETANTRPVSPRYNEISDIIRTNLNAVVAGAATPEDAAAQMKSRLQRAMR